MSDRRWPLRLGLPVAALVLAAGSSPAIAQRLPRFFFPAGAVVGAALALRAFGRALGRAVRQLRSQQRLPVLSLLINGLVVILLVVLPLWRLVGLMTPPAEGRPRILAAFGDWLGGEGYPTMSSHRGIDVAGDVGADVLAAAAGRVSAARDEGHLCGLLVAIVHDPHGYRTVYCHLAELAVRRGQEVARGQRIGTLGTTGQRAWPGYEHVHLELQRGTDRNAVEDPMPRTAGCFDARQRYPSDRLVLTYPVKC